MSRILDLSWLKTKEEVRMFLDVAYCLAALNGIKDKKLIPIMVSANTAIEDTSKHFGVSKNDVLKELEKEISINF